jgi:hypothetical protein
MTYHIRIILSDGKNLVRINGGIEWIADNVLIPVFNNQTVLFNYFEGDFLINAGSISRLFIFKTKEEIENGKESYLIEKFESKDFQINNCTKEVLNKIKTESSSTKVKSLLEKSFGNLENQVFVIMKFGDEELDSAYEGVIKPSIEKFNLKSIRVDNIEDSGRIDDQILENIAKSKLIISDLSGERPNCYYETGFAHALGKELILTIRDKEKIHFDLAGYRFITWKTEADLRKKLATRLKSILEK